MPEAETKAARPAAAWLGEIDAALKREDAWRKRAKKVVQRYRDERDANSSVSRVNILWSNTEVLKAGLYARTAKPDVRRRFPDAKKGNSASRVAAEVIERAISYCVDAYDVDSAIEPAVEDMLLPGRGIAWVSYEPEIEEVGEAEPPDEPGEEPADEPSADARIVGQKLGADYIYWEDFTHGLSRTWKDVPWVARRHALRKGEFDDKFPDAPKDIGGATTYTLTTAGDAKQGDAEFIEVWEIWSKKGKERIHVARGYLNILQADPDPLNLEGFFPCPEPIYSTMTTDTREPIPEFTQYQDQANELDLLSTRINRLTEQLKWRGIYDSVIDQDGSTLKALETADDGTLLPHENFAALREKGGIDGAIGFVPIEKIYPIIASLQNQRQVLVQEIYQITGISDIMRGSTDPNETKGAQQLKAQFGSMRMQKRQGAVQKFIRNLYRLKAEIIAEHFTPEILAEMTGYEIPTAQEQVQIRAQIAQAQQPPMPPMMGVPAPPPAPPPTPEMLEKASGPNWDDVMAILRSDKLRGYRVDIETDSTMLVDAEAEKASRVEFMGAMEKMMAGAYQAMMVAPAMMPLVKEITLFGMRSFKPGKSLEEAVETAFDELEKNPPQPPQKPGDQGKTEDPARGQAAVAEVQRKTQKDQTDAQLAVAEHQRQVDKDKADVELKAADLKLKAQGQQTAAAGDAQVIDMERRRLQHEILNSGIDNALKVHEANKPPEPPEPPSN